MSNALGAQIQLITFHKIVYGAARVALIQHSRHGGAAVEPVPQLLCRIVKLFDKLVDIVFARCAVQAAVIEQAIETVSKSRNRLIRAVEKALRLAVIYAIRTRLCFSDRYAAASAIYAVCARQAIQIASHPRPIALSPPVKRVPAHELVNARRAIKHVLTSLPADW